MREKLASDTRDIPRDVIEDWQKVRETYGLPSERGVVKMHDPEPLVLRHDQEGCCGANSNAGCEYYRWLEFAGHACDFECRSVRSSFA